MSEHALAKPIEARLDLTRDKSSSCDGGIIEILGGQYNMFGAFLNLSSYSVV
jgi:hypothetical protein